MYEQYFSALPQSKSAPELFKVNYHGKELIFQSDRGVFSKGELDEGSKILLESLPANMHGRILDIGCGWGAIGVITGVFHPEAQVVMSDVNQRALSLACINAVSNKVPAVCYLSDGLSNIPGDFDYIITNPPIRAGKQTVYRIFSECKDRLKPGGALFIVIRKQQGAPSAEEYLKSLYPCVSVVQKSKGYWVIKCQGEANGL